MLGVEPAISPSRSIAASVQPDWSQASMPLLRWLRVLVRRLGCAGYLRHLPKKGSCGSPLAHREHGFPERVLPANVCFSRMLEAFPLKEREEHPAFPSIEFHVPSKSRGGGRGSRQS